MEIQEIIEKQNDVSSFLSPIINAGNQLACIIPSKNTSMIVDEVVHFLYFDTKDYATMEQTILYANEYLLSESVSPRFFTTGEFVNEISQDTTNGNYEEYFNNFISANENSIIYNIKSNNPVFIIDEYTNSKSIPQKFCNILDYFIRLCSDKRSSAITNNRNYSDTDEPWEYVNECNYYNRLFFVSYGMYSSITQRYPHSYKTIMYPPLTASDFNNLIWHYYIQNMLKDKKTIHDDDFSEISQWYAGHMAGMEIIDVRRILAGMGVYFYNGIPNYKDKNTVEKIIVAHKKTILKAHNRLDIIEVKDEKAEGLENASNWIRNHKEVIKSFSNAPKGILLVGLPGTGKSIFSKFVASELSLPLVRLDMSKILGGLVGDSEKGMAEVFEDLKFVSPCILWIDEIEKMFGNVNDRSGGNSTETKLFGMLLTFIQENKKPIFIVATANDISSLPREFIRNGRFDQSFSLMMPEYSQCVKITKYHVNKLFPELKELQLTDDFYQSIFNCFAGTANAPRFLTGADIEAHIKELFWHKNKFSSELENCITSYTSNESSISYQHKLLNTLKEKIEETSKGFINDMRTLADPSSKEQMEFIARQYINMFRKGFTPAGNSDAALSRVHFKSDAGFIEELLKWEKDGSHPDTIPYCIASEKAEYKCEYLKIGVGKELLKTTDNTQNTASSVKTDGPKNSPVSAEKWYDIIFFHSIVPYMSKELLKMEKYGYN